MKRIAILLAILLIAPGAAFAHTGLDAPNGGETYSAGQTVTIQWHIWIMHNLQNWDLWYATDAPVVLNSCGDQPNPTWIPIAMDIPVSCTQASGSCSNPGPCQMEYVWTVPDGIASENVKIRVRMDNSGTDYYDVSNAPFTISSPTAVDDTPSAREAQLLGAYPNPFNPKTEIRYTLPSRAVVRLTVHDLAGRNLAKLVDGIRDAGEHAVAWNGRDLSGRSLSSGVYLVSMEADGIRSTRKLTLLQ